MKHQIRLLCALAVTLSLGGGLFSQVPELKGPIPEVPKPGGVQEVVWPERPIGLNTELFALDKEAYGNHVAEVLSVAFYPEDEARLILFRSSVRNDGGNSFKFKQEIAGLPVIGAMIVLRTTAAGEIYYRKGPILKVKSGSGRIDPPTTVFLGTVSTLYGGKSLDQIQYKSSCYLYDPKTGESIPSHILYIDARDRVDPDSMEVIINSQTGEILSEQPILIPALNRKITDCGNTLIPSLYHKRFEGDPPSVTVDALNKAYYSSELTYRLFYEEFSRNSYNDDGADFLVYTRYGDSGNSYWDPNNNRIRLGGGDQLWHEAYDVMAHEFSHGIAHHEGLEYKAIYPDAAALHESFGDCMAAFFDDTYSGNVYHIGENTVGLDPAPRVIDAPSLSYFPQAEHYDELSY